MRIFRKNIKCVNLTSLILLAITVLCSCGHKEQPAKICLLPLPRQLLVEPGSFEFNSKTKLYASTTDSLQNEITYLMEKIPLVLSTESAGENNRVELILSNEIEGIEAYNLNVTPVKITITARSSAGVFYGIQTLMQLCPTEVYSRALPAEFAVPCAEISDSPAFPWRGMLLDCSRHFMKKDFVKRYIDLLAYLKMNTLHWHLVDDQGWRIEIKKYPRLTEVGAWREDVKNEGDGEKYGGYYSQDDIREIVDYAKVRHINVVPEIEMPGHCQSAIAAYPELSCTGDSLPVETRWGVFKEIYCAGNPETDKFLKDVLAEVLALFPSKYIHIGGDEVPKYRWQHCAKCQGTIKRENLTGEEELQSFFLRKINRFLKENDRIMVGWDEIAEGGLPEDAVVQSWRGFEGANHAIKNGHSTIVSPTSHAYFDYDVKETDLKQVYRFSPIPTGCPLDSIHLVLGGECNLWSEHAPQQLVDSKVFPRILAMAEVLWTNPTERQYGDFYQRVQKHYLRLQAMGVAYGHETAPIIAKQIFFKGNGPSLFLKNTSPDLEIFFSVNDGPFCVSNAPIMLKETSCIRGIAMKNGKRYGDTLVVHFTQHAGIAAVYKLKTPFSEYYKAHGEGSLSDGFKGSPDFRDGQWQGWTSDDLVATYDFSEDPITLSQVTVSCLQSNNSWIFMPAEVCVEISTDGTIFTTIGVATPNTDPRARGHLLEEIKVSFDTTTVSYLRVTAKNAGRCPEWHEAAGSPAWLFVDEIILE